MCIYKSRLQLEMHYAALKMKTSFRVLTFYLKSFHCLKNAVTVASIHRGIYIHETVFPGKLVARMFALNAFIETSKWFNITLEKSIWDFGTWVKHCRELIRMNENFFKKSGVHTFFVITYWLLPNVYPILNHLKIQKCDSHTTTQSWYLLFFPKF